ncbi:hypothetical protein BT96DRAFT_1015585 [Gymnopus androsaceus JB14]|uniref:RING-type domain-containing protein n=1 Tax=Gymnopus androsaceus JB14 TaxID=1447944 RepID=A0A6A4I626_9AGAR|nr:hypothetical protein BT96DRAFT_1015585 [Gymnopus androsaceus JB14]
MSQCIICLSNIKDPVCIPCGHLFCSQCLSDYISSSSQDGYNSQCPTCRSSFPIVSPELTCLPKHFHRYITPSMRRVYLDSNATQALQQKLTASQTQVKKLHLENSRLMDSCERYMHTSRVHAEGETKAALEVERLTIALREQKLATRKAQEEASEWKGKHSAVKKQLDEGARQSPRKRTTLVRDVSSSDFDEILAPTPRRRVMRDLPRPKKKMKLPEPQPKVELPQRRSVPIFTSDSGSE